MRRKTDNWYETFQRTNESAVKAKNGTNVSKTEMWVDKPIKTLNLIGYDWSGFLFEHAVYNRVTIGRDEMKAEIHLSSLIVSGVHGYVYKDGDDFYYEDNDSSNGTYINGELYGREAENGQKKKKLEIGDILRIDEPSLSDKTGDAVVIIVCEKSSMFYLQKEISMKSDKTIEIGREKANKTDVVIKNNAVSTKHAELDYNGGETVVRDIQSTNGVYVNGVRIDGTRVLKKLDVVRIINSFFICSGNKIYYCYNEDYKNLLSINIIEKSVGSFKKKILLKDISLEVASGEMVLILGGSGAGKSTFIKAITGDDKAKASIKYKGIDIYKDKDIRRELAYVHQEINLRLEDTVNHTLLDALEFRKIRRRRRYWGNNGYEVDRVLSLFGMEEQKNQLVGELSGGQQKRVQIMKGYISDPDIFFLDEPDSGLDVANAGNLFKILRKIADEGKIVFIISHRPDLNPEFFNKVIVLAKGNDLSKGESKGNIGHLVFYGTVNEAYVFFGRKSLEEIQTLVSPEQEFGGGMADYYIEKFNKRRGKNAKI